MADRGKEARFFGERARVGDYSRGVHLEAVVVVESEGLVADYALVELEAGLFDAVAAARVAAVEYRHVEFLCNGVDCVEEAEEVFLCVDVLFAVGRQKDIFALLETEALVDVAGLDFGEVLVKHFCHGAAGDVGAFFGETAVCQVAAGMLRVAKVYVGDNIYDTAVGLLGQALVLAAIAGFHVENRNVQALGGNGRQA